MKKTVADDGGDVCGGGGGERKSLRNRRRRDADDDRRPPAQTLPPPPALPLPTATVTSGALHRLQLAAAAAASVVGRDSTAEDWLFADWLDGGEGTSTST